MLLFAGLWTLADREGRLEDRPRRIEAEVFPYFDIDIDALLDALHKAEFIVRYSVMLDPCMNQASPMHGSYIQVASWHTHQKPHHKEAKSVIPGVETGAPKAIKTVENRIDEPSIDQAWPKQEPSKGHAQLKRNASCPTDSLSLDSLNTDSNACVIQGQFMDFWERYPNKVGQDNACRMWLSVVTPENIEEVFTGLTRWEKSERWSRGIYHDPVNWLNEKLWKDSPPPTTTPTEDPFADCGYDPEGE